MFTSVHKCSHEKMSAQLKKNWCFIQLLMSTSIPQRLVLLKTLTDDQLAVICEIVLNILQGHLFVSPEIIKTLKKHRVFLRSLTSKPGSKGKKKKSLISNHRLIVKLLLTVHPLLETYVKE